MDRDAKALAKMLTVLPNRNENESKRPEAAGNTSTRRAPAEL
jgi:hypothetical protein